MFDNLFNKLSAVSVCRALTAAIILLLVIYLLQPWLNACIKKMADRLYAKCLGESFTYKMSEGLYADVEPVDLTKVAMGYNATSNV